MINKAFLGHRFQTRLRAIGFVRFFLAASFFLGSLLVQDQLRQISPAFHMFIYASMAYFFYACLVMVLDIFNVMESGQAFAVFLLALDFVFFTALIFLTGGVQSQIKYLFWILIFYTGVLFDFRGAILCSLLTGLLFAWMGNLAFVLGGTDFLDWLTRIRGIRSNATSGEIVLNSFGFMVFGVVSAVVGQRVRKHDRDMYEKEQAVTRLQAQVASHETMAQMGEMAAKMAHEIRNPLTSISASVEMLSLENDKASKVKLGQIALKEIKKLNGLIENFLQFTKSETQTLTPHSLSDVLAETLHVFALGNPGIELICELDADPKQSVLMDPDQMNQLLWNVLKNAAESMQGKGDVLVQTSLVKDRYILEIHDAGEGLSQEADQKSVFDPFVSSKTQGTGLGLAIVKSIAQDHGAQVSLTHRKNAQGATFHFSIPLNPNYLSGNG